MSTITLKAKSSSGTPYNVKFEVSDTITVHCNCKAGNFGKLCKHKASFLSGDVGMLFDLTQTPALNELLKHLKQSEYVNLQQELLNAKKAVEMAKKQEKKVRQTVERTLKEGILLTSED